MEDMRGGDGVVDILAVEEEGVIGAIGAAVREGGESQVRHAVGRNQEYVGIVCSDRTTTRRSGVYGSGMFQRAVYFYMAPVQGCAHI